MNIETKKNIEIIEKFKNKLIIEGYSENTIKIYTLYVRLFSEFIKKDLENINQEDIISYLSYLKIEKKVKSNSINIILSAIKHFYLEFLKSNIILDIKLPKKGKKIPIVLTKKEIQELIKGTKNKRNRLIIKFIYSTGVRVSECINMKISDLNFDEKIGKVVSGKGNKDRIIILSEKWINDYKLYLEKRSKKIYSKYLFCNSKGTPLSVDTIQKFLKISAKNANINKNVSPHTLRHSFATSLLEEDVNIRYIQQLLGHANLNTTQIYTKVNTNKLKNIKNPLDSMI